MTRVADHCLRLMRAAPWVASLAFIPLAVRHGLRIRVFGGFVEIRNRSRAIRLARKHCFYLPTILRQFDYYFSAVDAEDNCGLLVVDFSIPRDHHLHGYDDHLIECPAIAEPIGTVDQYLDLARLSPGDVVVDIGAYSGLTSILFDAAVAPTGRVIAVDADPVNVASLRRNVARRQERTGRRIDILHAAVWDNDGEISFSCEGNMGSSAADIVGTRRAGVAKVPAATLETVADRFNLDRVDFIKCDIEGAEAVIFDRPRFFERFRPRILVEGHNVGGEMTATRCGAVLSRFGYDCREVSQIGSDLPLLHCLPTGH